MPVYALTEELIFPDPREASDEGLLAYGGDLSPDRIVSAYCLGIFPWYDPASPDIMWWSPNPRMVLYPDKFRMTKSLKKRITRQEFEIRIDSAFEQVIDKCGKVPRIGQDGTWITEEMQDAYIHLHKLGIAHSVECWQNDKLVGGLYGISLGQMFFGESMFHLVSDASKVAFYHLSELSKTLGFSIIDCQMHTDHLESMGAEEISRESYLQVVEDNPVDKTQRGSWSDYAKMCS